MATPAGHYCGSLSLQCFFSFLTLPSPPLSLSLFFLLTATFLFLPFTLLLFPLSRSFFFFLPRPTPLHSSTSSIFLFLFTLPFSLPLFLLLMSTFAYLYPCLSLSPSLRLSHSLPTSSPSSTPSPYHGRTAVDRVAAVRTRQLADHEGSVRPPLPPSQTIPLLVPSSAVRPHSFSLSLSLSFSHFPSLVFSLLSLSPYPCILLSSSSSRSSRATDVRSAIERRSILPFKWIRHATGQTDAPPRYRRSSCRSRSFSIANVAAGWHFGRPGNCDLAPVDRRLVHTEILDFTSTRLPLRLSL